MLLANRERRPRRGHAPNTSDKPMLIHHTFTDMLIVLYDTISMSVRLKQAELKAILSWSATLIMCIITSAVSWLLVPGSKSYLVAYYAPALLLISVIAIAETREWFGVNVFMALLYGWLTIGGFVASIMIYESDQQTHPPAVYKNYDDCKQVRHGTDLVWRCSQEIS